jgi:hypothetical protein
LHSSLTISWDYYFGLLFPIVATIHIAGKAGFQLGKAVIVAGCWHLTPQARQGGQAHAPDCSRRPFCNTDNIV